METKECSRCKLDLPVNQFQLRFSYGEARRTECTTCKRAYDRARNALLRANPKPVEIRATVDEAAVCNGVADEWPRYEGAPRLQLFGLVGVGMAA